LFIDDYYSTFNRSNVTLVDDKGGVAEILEDGVRSASGESIRDLDVIIYATGFDTMNINFDVIGRQSENLAIKFGATPSNRHRMTHPKTLWGMHVDGFPNLHMVVGPQSLNPVTNVTLLSELQGKHIAKLIKWMKHRGYHSVEPTSEAVASWTHESDASSDGKVWLRCNNWYMKTTKDDETQARPRSSGMWMETYERYVSHLAEATGESLERSLHFSK